MMSQDGFFLPPPAPATPIVVCGGFAGQVQENYSFPNPNPNPNTGAPSSGSNNKRKRNLPRTPDSEVEVVAMSPKTLMATNRFLCEICNKGFQRDQNLQLHRRGHNLPWKLKQKPKDQPVIKKVYICPEKSCVHHDPSRALGDLTGVKKHFSRKHGEKKWKCDKCSKKYAVMSDWKAHAKICGTREYKCDCGTVFSRKDSFITHRAFCDALTEERMMRVNQNNIGAELMSGLFMGSRHSNIPPPNIPNLYRPELLNNNMDSQVMMNNSDSFLGYSSSIVLPGFAANMLKEEEEEEEENRGRGYHHAPASVLFYSPTGNMSATALLQKAAQIGSAQISNEDTTVFASMSNANMFHRKQQLFREQLSHQLAGLQAGYSSTVVVSDHHGLSNHKSASDGMRDFLGTLGGGSTSERRAFSEEEMANYKFPRMDGEPEPYKDSIR